MIKDIKETRTPPPPRSRGLRTASRSLEAMASEAGIPPEKKSSGFNGNENSYGPSPKSRRSLRSPSTSTTATPTLIRPPLRQALSDYTGTPPEKPSSAATAATSS